MIPRFRPALSFQNILRLTETCPAAPDLLEKEFARLRGYKQAVWFPYARVAIRAFLETLDDNSPRVVLSPYNCVALGNAVVAAGREPSYVDTRVNEFNQESGLFLSALKKRGVSAGIAVSLWAIPFELSDFAEAAKPILYDYALRALDPAPAPLREQDAAVYSLNWGKPLGSLRGAFLCGNSEIHAAAWRAWRNGRIIKGDRWKNVFEALLLKTVFSSFLFGLTLRVQHVLHVGDSLSGQDAADGQWMPKDWNSSGTRGLYAVTLERLRKASEIFEERRRQIVFYHERLKACSGNDFALPPQVSGLSHFPLLTASRDKLHNHLFGNGIYTSHRLFDRLLSDYPWLKGKEEPVFPNARSLTQRTLHLPLYEGLKESQQEFICQKVLSFYNA